jgi:hypothetical protein
MPDLRLKIENQNNLSVSLNLFLFDAHVNNKASFSSHGLDSFEFTSLLPILAILLDYVSYLSVTFLYLYDIYLMIISFCQNTFQINKVQNI